MGAKACARMGPVAALLGLALAGCATTINVSTDYDRAASFSQYHTFRIVSGTVMNEGMADPRNTLVKDRFSEAIRAQLMAKGLVPDDAHSDLDLIFVVGARTRRELEGVSLGPPYDPYWWGPGAWWWPGYADFWVQEYREGTVLIDLIDTRTHRLVWRAMAKTIDRDFGNPATVQKVVAKAFGKFPPRP